MKNKKSLLGLGLLALVLVLGVGYAVVSDVVLTITGTASVATEELKVSFEGTVTADQGVTANATKGSLKGNIQVTGLAHIGDTATATYTIQNLEADVAAEITKKSITVSNSEYFEVTTSVDNDALTIARNGTATVTVTVQLIKKPITEAESSTDITVELKAAAVQQ